ncbi:MAG: HesB/IscA family protein [Candidatus Kapaibacterium sp.]
MNLTENAINQFKKLITESENPASGIRFYTVQGCCSPYLQMDVAKNPSPGDNVLQFEGLDIYITPEAKKILSEITIDYSDEGFRSVKKSDNPFTSKCY